MRMQVLSITWRTLRGLFDRKNLVTMLALPVVFSLVFGLLLGGGDSEGGAKYQLALVLEEHEGPAAALRQALSNNQHILLQDVSDEAEARRQVQSSQVVAALIVPAEFNEQIKAGTSPVVRLVRESDTNLFLALEQELSSIFSHMTSAAVTASLASKDDEVSWQATFDRVLVAWHEPTVTVGTRDVVQKQAGVATGTSIAIGFIVMFVMMGQAMGAGSILEERSIGTWQRILASPVTRSNVLLGYIFAYFLCGWVQFGIYVVLETVLFKADFGGGPGLIAVTTMLVLCAVSAGMAIAGIVRTHQQQQAVSAIVMNVTSMLGGLFFPIELFNPAMVTLAKMTPQYWARQGYIEVILRNGDWQALQTPLLVLGCFTVVFFLIGIRGVKFE